MTGRRASRARIPIWMEAHRLHPRALAQTCNACDLSCTGLHWFVRRWSIVALATAILREIVRVASASGEGGCIGAGWGARNAKLLQAEVARATNFKCTAEYSDPHGAWAQAPPTASGGVRGRSRRRLHRRRGLLNANANANGKRAFAFVPSMELGQRIPHFLTLSTMQRHSQIPPERKSTKNC